MRITASVLRGFIRETLLREAAGPLGPLPGASGTSVKNKTVLKQLQAIIGAEESGVYDDETENKWDAFIDANVKDEDVAGVSIEDVKTDWAAATKEMTLSDKLDNLTFTPDIQGMLSFAKVFKPAAGEDAGEDDATGGLPYRLTPGEPDVWPAGLTLDDGDRWMAWVESDPVPTTAYRAPDMFNRFVELKTAIEAGKRVWLCGYPDARDGATLYAYSITDVTTLDSIFVFSSGDEEEEAKYTPAQLAAAVTSHPYKTSENDPDVWPDANLNVDNPMITSWFVKIAGVEKKYTSEQMKSNYNYFAGVINAYIKDTTNNPMLYLLGQDADYKANFANNKVWRFRITDIDTLNKIIRPKG